MGYLGPLLTTHAETNANKIMSMIISHMRVIVLRAMQLFTRVYFMLRPSVSYEQKNSTRQQDKFLIKVTRSVLLGQQTDIAMEAYNDSH